ncbi:MAG: hypothetical protein H7315_07670 [Herminiimonas sp.]|nr:hypothetical protein [Herminiimonas sp.]
MNTSTANTQDSLADYYALLHERITLPEALFDVSWGCDAIPVGDRLRWSHRLLQHASSADQQGPSFSRVVDRLVLLKPLELQKVLCATALLRHQEELRRCIDGTVVRKLQTVVGTSVLDRVMRSRLICRVKPETSDLSVSSLTAEAFGALNAICVGSRKPLLDFMRVALPVHLEQVCSSWNEAEFEEFLLETHVCFPEIKWLSG